MFPGLQCGHVEKRLSQVTGEKASPFSFSQPGTVPFPDLNFCCDLLPLLFMLLTIPSNNSRGKQIAAPAQPHQLGWGKHRSEQRAAEKLSPLPFPKGPGRGKKHIAAA